MSLYSKGTRILTRACVSRPNYMLVHSILENLIRLKSKFPMYSTASFIQSDSKRFYSLPSNKFADFEKQRIDYFLQLQDTFKNQSMSPKIKSERLKLIMLQLIPILPNGEFSNKQLPFINSVINLIDNKASPNDSFTPDEMILLLKSVLGGMSLKDVRFIDFFPRFYNALRESQEYASDQALRLELFEIFINYVLLSTKRNTVSKVIDAFIDEEQNIHNNEANQQVVEIVLHAFESVRPDTETVLLLANLCPDLSLIKKELSDCTMLELILSNFFKASDEEISETFEDNFVSERLIKLIDIIEGKVDDPILSYVEILYFATKNNFNDVSVSILDKLERKTSFFKESDQFQTLYEADTLFALVSASLKFNKVINATNLLAHLRDNKKETEFVEEEWMALLQYDAFQLHEYKPAIELINDYNSKLESLNKEYFFQDVDSLNLVLESLCWSKKDFPYIDKFREDFQEMYQVPVDAKSVSTVLNYLCEDESNNESIKLASSYFLKFKDLVDWENDYEGFYMLSLFQLTANIWKNESLSWNEKMEVYKNVQRYEYLFNKECIYEMMKSAIKYNAGTFAIKVLLDQTPELKKNDPRLKVPNYQKIFDCIYDYLTKSPDKELNKRVYKYLAEYFSIPYEYYPGFIKMFIDCGDPEMSLKVFADMKRLSKESKLPPPNEEFYIYLLKSFAKFQYEEGIFKLHLSIKMDLSINLDIKLLNSLMESYAALEDPFKTRDVFNLAFSLPKENGTNNESAYWMLKSLKYATLGHANDFYNGLSQYDMIPDPYLFGELLIANCYFEQYRTAFETLQLAEQNGDYHLINTYVLKTLHNHCLHDGVRDELKAYYQEKFPKEWDELTKTGQLQDNREKYPNLLENPYERPYIETKQISDS